MEKVWTEQRMVTKGEQVALVEPNEMMDGIVFRFGEVEDKGYPRLYLTYDETIELTNMLKSMVDRYKSNSL